MRGRKSGVLIQSHSELTWSSHPFTAPLENDNNHAIIQKHWLGSLRAKPNGHAFESSCRKVSGFGVCMQTESGVVAPKISRDRRPQNKEGEFYVDNRCIDCDTCSWMAPRTFKRIDGKSAVYNQPSSAEERQKALQALISCPIASIHTENSLFDILQVQKAFPLPIDEKTLPGVYHCGYHSEKSYGGTSYLIVHPKGSILVDSPRYSERLAHCIEALGGARYMLLTHCDDVADHERWAKRLQCDRILHMYEVEVPTADVEMKLEGHGPWSIGSDFDIIFTPGHTKGSVSLFYKPLKALFTGDHLTVSPESNLEILEEYNKFSVTKQLESIRPLLLLDFLWILPGHGRKIEFKDLEEKNAAIEAFLASGTF